MKELIPYIFAMLAGIFTTLESSINAHLGKIVSPKIATMHDLITGVIIILLANLFKGSISEYTKIFHVNPRWLIGGVFGALIIYFITKTIPSLGITVTLTIVIASQILSSLYIDTLILKQQKLDFFKIIGALLVIIGVVFITIEPSK